MKTISKTEYENETEVYQLVNVKLVDIGLPNVYFAKAAINMAKSVQHLVAEKDKEVSLRAIETAEKCLRREVTQEECEKASREALLHSVRYTIDTFTVAYYAYYAAAATVNTAFFAARAADYAAYYYAAGVYVTTSTRITACDIFRQEIPWNLVCSFQIAKCFGNKKDEQFIKEIMKNKNLINYATILLEDENLRKEFEFLMKDYMNK